MLNFAAFAPGRGLPVSCLNKSGTGSTTGVMTGCIFMDGNQTEPLGGELTLPDAKLILINEAECTKTAQNISDTNKVYQVNRQAVLGPADPPSDLEFQATSFSSGTACKMVTDLCDVAETNKTDHFHVECNAATAGLNLTAEFALASPKLQYFTDSAKLHPAEQIPPTGPQQQWSLVFGVTSQQIGLAMKSKHTSHLYTDLGLQGMGSGSGVGVLSCDSSLFDVVSQGKQYVLRPCTY